MEKKSEETKEEKEPLVEKKAPVEKLSIERKPRWNGPQPFDTRCQPWQYVFSFVFLAVLFGTIFILATYKYI